MNNIKKGVAVLGLAALLSGCSIVKEGSDLTTKGWNSTTDYVGSLFGSEEQVQETTADTTTQATDVVVPETKVEAIKTNTIPANWYQQSPDGSQVLNVTTEENLKQVSRYFPGALPFENGYDIIKTPQGDIIFGTLAISSNPLSEDELKEFSPYTRIIKWEGCEILGIMGHFGQTSTNQGLVATFRNRELLEGRLDPECNGQLKEGEMNFKTIEDFTNWYQNAINSGMTMEYNEVGQVLGANFLITDKGQGLNVEAYQIKINGEIPKFN